MPGPEAHPASAPNVLVKPPRMSAREELHAVSARFPKGYVHFERRMRASFVAAMIVDYDRDFIAHGRWFSEDIHFFDMTLTSRPPGARGYFEDAFSDYRPVGKTLFAPAGYRYRGEGGCGRQRSLSLFLNPRELCLEDEIHLGAGLEPVLQNCLQLEAKPVQDILGRIAQEVAEPGFASELLLEGLGLTLLVETARTLQALQMRKLHKGGLSPRRLRTIEERILSGEKLPSLGELAALCQLSQRQLTRAFREETGESIGAFVRRLTVERAEYLLTGTTKPIGIIASELGYDSVSAFSAAFRRSSGRSPREYRVAARIPTGGQTSIFRSRQH